MESLSLKTQGAWRSRRLEHGLDLLRVLVGRDLKVKYKRSALGIVWSLLNPFSQVLIFTFVFKRALSLDIAHYGLFVFAGVLAWSWFSAAVNAAPGVIVQNPELVRRPGFPVALLPVLTVVSNGIHFLLALPVLLVFAMLGTGFAGGALLALPLLMSVQFMLTLGLTYLPAALNVRFRDTQHLVGILMMLGFYVTPVFYSADAVPPELRIYYDLNPIAVLLTGYRRVLIEHRWPETAPLLWVLALSAALLVAGYVTFRRASVRFAEEL
jgi:lipopolysaccharide transport system permease protein